jgi:phycocyanobilin lyase beta subunit
MSDAHALKLIQAVEAADSSARLLEAVQQLADARLEAAIPILIAALSYNNPGAAVAAVDGLILLGDVAVDPLLELLDRYNYSARAWAIRALAGIGNPRGLALLLDAVQTDFAMSVRRAAAKGLGTMRWHLLPLEEVPAAQEQALAALLQVCHDEEWIVRYAAIVGLQTLAIATSQTRPDWLANILSRFEHMAAADETSAVRARVCLAQQQLLRATRQTETEHPYASSLEADWHSTMEKLYNRKSQERQHSDSPFPEGDPRRFQQVAASMLPRIKDT